MSACVFVRNFQLMAVYMAINPHSRQIFMTDEAYFAYLSSYFLPAILIKISYIYIYTYSFLHMPNIVLPTNLPNPQQSTRGNYPEPQSLRHRKVILQPYDNIHIYIKLALYPETC